jgi:hypothetical protein
VDSRRNSTTSPGPGSCGVPPEVVPPLPDHPLSPACWTQQRLEPRGRRSVRDTVSSRVSLQSRRGRLPGVELDCLDEAALGGTIQFNASTYSGAIKWSTRRRLGEQLDIARLGRARHGACRRAFALEGALSLSALESPSGESSIWPTGPSSLGRIGVCREEPSWAVDPSEPTKPASCRTKELPLT